MTKFHIPIALATFFLSVIPTFAATPSSLHALANKSGVPGQPAAWQPHDMIVSLHNLPQRYSCDDLWYKFHDVLLVLGARPDMKILTYRCGRGVSGYSPKVQLRFATPTLLTPAQTRWMDIDATPQTLRLAPGDPKSWKAGDCELMRQVKDELLQPLAQKVVSFELACAAPPSGKWRYSVTLRTLEPVSTPARVASVASADPRPLER